MLNFATQEQGRFMGENGPMNLPCGASSTAVKADHLLVPAGRNQVSLDRTGAELEHRVEAFAGPE